MGILGSLLKTGLTMGAAAIPGAGPFIAPVVAAGLSGGQNPGILNKAAAAGGAIAGQQLGGALFGGGEEAVSQPMQKAAQGMTLASPEMMNDPLSQFALSDLQKRMMGRNSFFGGRF